MKVPDNRDPGAWKHVEVVSVDVEEPPFPCKPILGLYTGSDVDASLMQASVNNSQ